MSANASDLNNSTPPVTTPGPDTSAGKSAAVPKKITNAQTVCNEKNEKGKLCNGHLKQLRTAGEPAEVHLRGDDVLFKCQTCGTLYMGPPLGHLRDPEKQHRFVQAELTALLQAAGGTMPVIKKNERGVYVLAEALAEHAQAPAKPATAPVAKPTVPIAPADSSPQAAPADLAPDVVPASVAPPSAAVGGEVAPKPAERKASGELHRGTYSGVVDTGPVSGETHEQKITRLTKLAAAAKQKAEEGGAG